MKREYKVGDWKGGRIVVGWRVRCVEPGGLTCYLGKYGSDYMKPPTVNSLKANKCGAEYEARCATAWRLDDGNPTFRSVTVVIFTRKPTAKEFQARVLERLESMASEIDRRLGADRESAKKLRSIATWIGSMLP